jgi:hypothetical protein
MNPSSSAAEVARVEPSPEECLLGGFRQIPVLLHDVGTSVHDLSDLSRRDVAHGVVHDACLHVDDRLADGAFVRVEILRLQHAGDRAHLGLPEGVVDRGIRKGTPHRLEEGDDRR